MMGIFHLFWSFLLKMILHLFRFSLVTVHWFRRFLKIRCYKWKKCLAQKELDKAMRDLGAEVYFASDKEGDLRGIPAVKQQLSRVEEVERKVLAVEELADKINRGYSETLDRIKAKCEERLARVKTSSSLGRG